MMLPVAVCLTPLGRSATEPPTPVSLPTPLPTARLPWVFVRAHALSTVFADVDDHWFVVPRAKKHGHFPAATPPAKIISPFVWRLGCVWCRACARVRVR